MIVIKKDQTVFHVTMNMESALANQTFMDTDVINVLRVFMDFQIVKVGLFFNISERNYLILP